MSKILIVDDEPGVRVFLHRVVGRMGYEVLEAPDGEAALELFNEEKIALSLVDINMPKMDGLAFLEEIKKIDQHAIVIIMTGFPSADTIIKTIEDDGYTYVTKPLQVKQIEDLVERGLELAGKWQQEE